MNIQRIICNPLEENCYVVSDESGECVIIDCGVFYQEERTALMDIWTTTSATPSSTRNTNWG